MALRREDLTPQFVEHFCALIREEGQFVPPTDAERAEALEAVLAEVGPGADLWLFGYGSLMWNPLLRYAETRPGRVHGYRRNYCITLRWGRGSADRPGLMLGLDAGGSCTGLAFRIEAARLREEMVLLWRREMISGIMQPRWVRIHTPQGAVRGLTFIVNRRHPLYDGLLPRNEVARRLAHAGGWIGTCREYLENTVALLREMGIRDRYMMAIHDAVQAEAGASR